MPPLAQPRRWPVPTRWERLSRRDCAVSPMPVLGAQRACAQAEETVLGRAQRTACAAAGW